MKCLILEGQPHGMYHLNGLSQTYYLLIYLLRDEALSGSELTSKLEPAFLAGLRCQQPQIRQKFVDVFDGSIKKRIYDRLLYIVCSQNWEAMAGHFWIKQCIEVGDLLCFVLVFRLVPSSEFAAMVNDGSSLLSSVIRHLSFQSHHFQISVHSVISCYVTSSSSSGLFHVYDTPSRVLLVFW